MSTFDTFKGLMGDIADDYKKALDDLLDRDEDNKDKGKDDAVLGALAAVPGLAQLPLGAAQALGNAGAAAPAALPQVLGGAAGANPLAALAGAAGGANPLAAPSGAAGGSSPLAALGGLAGAAGNTASMAEALVSLPQQLAQLSEGITRLLSVLEATAGALSGGTGKKS
jgi:hypothetical protein